MTAFDFDAQAAATRVRWDEMAATRPMPSEGRVDLLFVAGEGAEATEFLGWLEDAGFEVEHYEADDEDEDDPRETVEAQTPPMPLTVEAVQAQERRATEAALRFGFAPDGWGFIGS